MPEILKSLVEFIKVLFDLIGILLVFWGGISAAFLVIKKEIFNKENVMQAEETARGLFAGKMIMALEFFISVDIINTIEEPTWNSLGMLAGLVFLRSLLNYLLNQEIKNVTAIGVQETKKSFFKKVFKK